MKCLVYLFLSTIFIAHYNLNKHSSLGQNILCRVQATAPVNTSTDVSNKETKAIVGFKNSSLSFNKWDSFDSWTCNTPQVYHFGSTKLRISIESPIETKRDLFRILLFGGFSKLSSSLDPQSETWLYYEETNSWKSIDDVTNGPPAISHVQLATLCSSHAILVDTCRRNSSWIFMPRRLEWKRVMIAGYGPYIYSTSDYLRVELFATVAVRSSNSSCDCSEDVLVFVYLSPLLESITQLGYYRIICVIEHTMYRWKKVGSQKFRADRDQITIVATQPGKETLYFIVEKCIWTYFVEKSIWNETRTCLTFDPKFDFYLTPVFQSDPAEIIFFRLTNHLIVRLLLSNGSVFFEKNLGLIPQIDQVYSVRVVSNIKVIVYLSERDETCGSSIWTLERDDVTRVWTWNKQKKTILFPPIYELQSFWKDTYYRIFPSLSDSSNAQIMWSLSMRTMKWQIVGRLNATGINVDETKKWYRSESTHIDRNAWLIVSDSYTTLITSKNHIQQMRHPLTYRRDFTLVSINSSSVLLFGGRSSSGTALDDLWEFSLTHRMWKHVNRTESECDVPARFSHAAAVLGFNMFVIGGYSYTNLCKRELWKYNWINNSWNILLSNNNLTHPLVDSCEFAMTAQAEMLWITAKVYSNSRDYKSYNVWMFIIESQSWTFVDEIQISMETFLDITAQISFWQGYLVRFQVNDLFYMKVGCLQGLASSNISRVPCHFCKVGFYAHIVGTTKCKNCPNGTTTRGERSSKMADCNVCVSGYCRHGSCLVVSNSLTQISVCKCPIGFTGSLCENATYYYIGTGIIILLIIISLLVIVLQRNTKSRRARETAFRRHIQILNDAWQINWQEIRLENEIGAGASGRVWKGQYRDMEVAIKMLIGDDDPQSSLEFAREIRFMQTMRHPNIVLFIGAGTTSAQAQPFLVVEFVHRGSLRHVLEDVSIEIDQYRKVAFALDASKGMEFLHKLDPPRIHRDLKSDNLLVSQSWIVKVADFGLGKSVWSTREHQKTSRYMPLIDSHLQSDPRFDMRGLSKDGIGTVRWRAPELSRHQSYDRSIDVYRYTKTFV